MTQGNNQSDLVSRLTLRNPEADYRRSPQDQTQRFVANGIYDLPFGKGQSLLERCEWCRRQAGGRLQTVELLSRGRLAFHST